MKYKIVADSSCNLFELNNVEYSIVPLKIITDSKEYVDTSDLNVENMLAEIKEQYDHSSVSCPEVEDWLNAFGDADIIFGVTFTSGLSGSFDSARSAKLIYEKQHPGRKVFIFDSLSVGPELTLIVQKIAELIRLKKTYAEIRNTVMDYMHHTHLMFALPSLDNFARHNHISQEIAKSANGLGVRVVGRASFEGKLEPIIMCRGQKRALKKLVAQIKSAGYQGGQIIIAHTQNEKSALSLAELLKEAFGNIQVNITQNAGFCSYYAEAGGLLVGFES